MATGARLEIGTVPQLALFDADETSRAERTERAEPKVAVRFVKDEPREIWLGGRRLDEYLIEAGLAWVLQLREFLRSLAWGAFEQRYRGGGRPPYHPAAMMSLILYGVCKGATSLRELERLARVDLGAMWVCGGIAPDHSAIGRFLALHADLVTESFFEQLTRQVLRRTNGSVSELAGDGTVIQAAASAYRKLTEEAAKAAEDEARQQAAQNPEDEQAQRKAQQAEHVAEEISKRAAKRRESGKAATKVTISPTEPDAVVQRLKNQRTAAPSYKPSVLANKDRIIVGHAVDGSCETAVVEQMLEQAERIADDSVDQLMLDAGYFAALIFVLTLRRDIDLLCPEGNPKVTGDWNKTSSKFFPKSRFVYDEKTDTYRCPANQTLIAVERLKRGPKPYTRYRTTACKTCELRDQCTSGRHGRSVKRYPDDEYKEIQRQVMQHPHAQRLYRRRQAWVEPVYADIKDRQGLRRFRRRGAPGVRLEFSIHAIAHNLRRLLALVPALPRLAWCAISACLRLVAVLGLGSCDSHVSLADQPQLALR